MREFAERKVIVGERGAYRRQLEIADISVPADTASDDRRTHRPTDAASKANTERRSDHRFSLRHRTF